jgi:hypothetical protein
MENTLSKRISAGQELTEAEINSLVDLLGYKCYRRTKLNLSSVLGWIPDILNHGIFDRVILENGNAVYCAGQSYPDEIRTVRRLLLRN